MKPYNRLPRKIEKNQKLFAEMIELQAQGKAYQNQHLHFDIRTGEIRIREKADAKTVER